MSSVQITVDARSTLRELKRLEGGPDIPDLLRLERVITTVFLQTQVDVHHVTSSLARSGKLLTDWVEHRFTGEVEYGGASLGSIHDPVTYAYYEARRANAEHKPPGVTGAGKVTPDHDFMRSTREPGVDVMWIRALLQFLDGGGE